MNIILLRFDSLSILLLLLLLHLIGFTKAIPFITTTSSFHDYGSVGGNYNAGTLLITIQNNNDDNPMSILNLLQQDYHDNNKKKIFTSSLIVNTRGGATYYDDDYDDDQYDDDDDIYDNDEEDDDDEQKYDDDNNNRRNKRRPTSQSTKRQPPPRGPQRPPQRPPQRNQYDPRRNRTSRSQQQQQQQRPFQRPPQRRMSHKSKNTSSSQKILKTTTDMAQKSIDLATTATVSTLKTTGKAAYYLTAPKFVHKDEIYGIWRFDQSISSSVCAANIELTPRGDVITKFNDEDAKYTGYIFQSKKWPRSCSIEFEAEAFQGVDDERPVRFYYKGYFRRKMADKSVIKIVGKIYEVKQRRWRGKDSPGVPGVEVGSFVARKRIQQKIRGNTKHHEDEYDDEYDDDYDDYSDNYYDDDYDNEGDIYDD